jgi:hypothetical protein
LISTAHVYPLCDALRGERGRGEEVGTYLCPSDNPSFQHHLRFGAKVFRFPNDQIGQTPDCNLANQMRHSMTDCPTFHPYKPQFALIAC